jgi:dolichyl-phosphate beta-glucosyltransferase
MERTVMKKNKGKFTISYLMSLSIGIALLALLWSFAGGLGAGMSGKLPLFAGIFLLAAFAGLAVRSMARKVFFGDKISFHQSFSFECVAELARLLNPLTCGSGMELEFIKRETSTEKEVDEWVESKFHSIIIAALAVITLMAAFKGEWIFLFIMLFFLLIMFASSFFMSKRTLPLCAVYLIAMALEGGIFAFALRNVLPPSDSYMAYSCFTILFAISPLPFALGFAELSILPFLSVSGILQIMLLFHAVRILPSLIFAPVYFARYKFALRDFFRPGLADAIHGSRRPKYGWTSVPAGSGILASIVIPAYNEEKRLPDFLKNVQEYMDARKEKFEVIIVDDGSKDATVATVEGFTAKDPRIRIARQIPNQGKGAAVRRGILEARGDLILFADADGATPISELDKFLPLAAKGHEILIGSRKAGSESVERSRNSLRAMMGMVFYKIVNFFAVPGIRDTQCGFKIFRHDVAAKLFSKSSEKGWAFDVEILYLAQLYGYAIVEVPVNWHEVEGSKVNPIKDSMKMLLAIFRIRRKHSGFINEP